MTSVIGECWKARASCAACDSSVWVRSSETPGEDYDWRCMNADCPNGKGWTATGDMEQPDWMAEDDG